MIRLVAFDLDGTVLSETGQLSESSAGAINSLCEHGVSVASISGRNVEKSQAPFADHPDLAAALYVGSYNGALVLGRESGGKRGVLHDQRLDPGVYAELTAYIRDERLNLVYCHCVANGSSIREQYISDRDSDSLRGLAAQTGMDFPLDGDLVARMGSGDLGPPPKLIIFPGEERRDAVLNDMHRRFGESLYLARTGTDRIETMHPEVNKGVALGEVARACGASPGETLALGDGDNDLPMLRSAAVGVLLGNADAQTREDVAGSGVVVGASFEDDGFAEAVRRYVLEAEDG